MLDNLVLWWHTRKEKRTALYGRCVQGGVKVQPEIFCCSFLSRTVRIFLLSIINEVFFGGRERASSLPIAHQRISMLIVDAINMQTHWKKPAKKKGTLPK